MAGMGLIWILLLVAVVFAAFRLAGPRGSDGGEPPAEDTPLKILERRYARGEIDREEFEQRRRDLRS